MLTKRQKQALDFIKSYTQKKGFAPSLEEIGRHLGLSAVSTAHHHVRALEDLGYLRKEDNQPRAIDVYQKEQMVRIPLSGTIAAGNPIEAIEEKESITVPRSILSRGGDFFALKVTGDSMVEENIDDGDVVILRRQNFAETGQKVVALIDNSEATLKKFSKGRNNVTLIPGNSKYEPITLEPDRLNIQGIVIDVIKTETRIETLPKITFTQELEVQSRPLPIDQVVCGDAIENLKKTPSKSVDLIIADPPYNLSKGNKLQWSAVSGYKGFGGKWNKVMEAWDNQSLSELFEFSFAWLSECKRILKETGSIWVFGTYHNIGVINTIFQLLEIEIINEVIWYKRNAFPNLSGRRLTASHENLLWGHVGKKRSYYFDYKTAKAFFSPNDLLKPEGKQMRTVWDIPNNKESNETKFGKHPTQKPLSVCKRIISVASKEGDIILAPFTGAGSECVAAKMLNRHYIGIELEKEYVDIAKKRLENCKVQTSF
ncbi:MAG: transcriptional repressor LexA [Candidatus Kerfeldbacteria bacterium]|nr:transcriptional repressor LexA [Candidatus Kerfeldbacteria bacterium]